MIVLSATLMFIGLVQSAGRSCSENILKTKTFLSVVVPQSISGPESFFGGV